MTNTKPEQETQYVSYDTALERSLEYFDGEALPARVFLDKYALRDNDQNLLESTPEDMHRRIARELARVEKIKYANSATLKALSEEEIFGYLDRFKKIIPQGSPMYGIGNPYQYISLSNCFISETPSDSYGGILHTDQQFVQICKRRGGIGTDISELRPAGVPTRNAARTSTGAIGFMSRFSNSIREVAQNGRRGASMLSISVHHPESVVLLDKDEKPKPITLNNSYGIIKTTTEWYNPEVRDFATIKYDDKEVTGANVSIRLTDEFLNAVEAGTDYQQRWPVESPNPTIVKDVDARRVWNKIIRSAWQMAEPGLLFWDNIIRESPADCYAAQGFKTISTNPCSEIPLSVLDSCRLLLINLYSYVRNPFTSEAYFDYEEFKADAKVAQRLMDDIIDLEIECIDRILDKIKSDPEPDHIKATELDLWIKIRTACTNGRRTGTGITALGDTLAALNIRYGSEQSIQVTEEIYKVLKLAAYRSSVEMAIELGPFPVWNHEQEKDNPFLLRIKEEDLELWELMKVHGRRHIAILTTAPAGSVSIEAQSSSGIEPVFMLSYTRRKKGNPGDTNFRSDFVDGNGDHWMEFVVYHSKVTEWMKITGETDVTKSPWFGCCAEDLDWTQRINLQAAAQRHIDHAISSTINLPEDVPVEKVAEIYMAAWKAGLKGITVYRNNCRSGVMIETKEKEVDKQKITKTTAPDRPEELECDIHHIRVKGQPYFVLVGLIDGEPYEVFAGSNSQEGFDKHIKKGIIVREKRGKYTLKDGDRVLLDSITSFLSEDQEALTRMTSTALRHGADINFIVHQLEKTKGEMNSFSRAKARALKKYIPDGTKVHGEECPSCNQSNLVRAEGCVQCMSCGWSRCS